MRRTLALLTLPAFLCIAELFKDARFNQRSIPLQDLVGAPEAAVGRALFLPLLLLAGSCLGREQRWKAHLHLASLVTLLAYGMIATAIVSVIGFTLYSALPFLGLLMLSLLEITVFLRRPHGDPEGRLAVELLALLGLLPIAVMLLYWLLIAGGGIASMGLMDLAYPLGSAAAFLLPAWGLWKRQRWASWVGSLVAVGAIAAHAWPIAGALLLGIPGHTGILFRGPELALQAVLIVLLIRRIRRERRTTADEAAK